MYMKHSKLSNLLVLLTFFTLSSACPSYNDHYDASDFWLRKQPSGVQNFSSYQYASSPKPSSTPSLGARRGQSRAKFEMKRRGDGHFGVDIYERKRVSKKQG